MIARHELWRTGSFQNTKVVFIGIESHDLTQIRSDAG